MANLISIGAVNVNIVQQNAGVFMGQVNVSGWDSHQKLNLGHGALFGVYNWSIGNFNRTFDGLEVMDGIMMDQDIKAQFAITF